MPRTEKRVEELSALNSLINELSLSTLGENVFSLVYEKIHSIIKPDFVILYLIENGKLLLKGNPHKDSSIKHKTEKVHKVNECLCGLVAETGESVFSEDIQTDPRCTLEECKEAGIRSFAALPLKVKGKLIGILGIASINKRRFSDNAVFLESIAGSVAIGIHSTLLYEQTQKSEVKMKSIVRAAPIGIGVVVNRVFKEVNERLCKISGYSKDELIGKNSRIVYPTDEDYEYVGSVKYNMIEKSGTGAVETRFRRKDGEIINVLLSSTPLDLEDLSVGVMFTALDITEQKQAEDLLRESENQLRTIVEGTHALLANVDANGYFTYVNDATVRATGYARSEELIGKSYLHFIHPEDRQRVLDTFINQVNTHQPYIMQEFRIIDTEGNVKWFSFLSTLMIKDGQFVGQSGVAQDVTERKQVEEALRESEKRFRDLAELLPEAAFETDTNMNLNFANKHAFTLFGYSQQDFEDGINALDLLVPEDRERAVDNFAQRFRGKSFGAIEYCALRKDGSSFPVFLHAAPILDQGIAKGLRGVIVDLSERKLIEEQLQQAQKMEALGTLSGGIAHEFNNILGIIIGNTELAIDDVPEWNPAKDRLEEIRTASLRAKDVVRRIMSFARKTPATQKPIQISTIIQESLKLMRATIPANIEVKQEILCESEMILANPAEINQILMNLCNNSVHAIENDTGMLKIRLETTVLDHHSASSYESLRAGEYVKLTVKDNGSGINPKLISLIFDPYFTTKDVDKGLGMGLAIVYGIVKKHDGAISVISKLGKGTTVEVLFPITKETAQIDKEVSEDLPRGTERILFVDDEASLVKLVTQILEQQGYEVVGKTSSTEALKLFQEEPEKFDLVITDMAMPELPGDRLAQGLIKIHPTIPIIICTGHSDRMDEEKAIKSGIAAYAMKPLAKTELVNTVRRVLDKSKGSN